LLIGIASNLAELLADHQSLERRLVPVPVPLMDYDELCQIVTGAEAVLHNEGLKYRFSSEAKNQLAQVAAGFPWFVHVLGQAALAEVAASARGVVQKPDIIDATESLINNRFAQQFSDMYQNAVRDSAAREMVLRSFAEWREVDIPTSEIYRMLKDKLRVTNPSTYKGHLCSVEYGDILFSPIFQARGLVRFRNEVFKAYVRMRRSIFTDVDIKVSAAREGLY
jgi:hypothetical protein